MKTIILITLSLLIVMACFSSCTNNEHHHPTAVAVHLSHHDSELIRDSLIENAIHTIAKRSPDTYFVYDSTDLDESWHSIDINGVHYAIGSSSGYQSILTKNTEAAMRIMNQLDYRHIRYFLSKSRIGWEIAYTPIYVPTL